MNLSATRLTLYAIISALEEDLRDAFVGAVDPHTPAESVYGVELFEKLIGRFHEENGPTAFLESFADLADFLDFKEAYDLYNRHSKNEPKSAHKELREFNEEFSREVRIRNRTAHTRPLHIDDLPFTLDLANDLIESTSLNWNKTKKILSEIASDPGSVLSIKIPEPPKDKVSHNLPIPDFDETGFVGRRDQTISLNKMIKGPYPVITIVGEGGLGKTALALKGAYDLLEEVDCGFDCIVWSSAKTTTVTAAEIRNIKGAIVDSMGLFEKIADELKMKDSDDDLLSVLNYLSDFRILIILDNLETIVDSRVISFFENLPRNIKVLTTSRIGLGEFERRLTLESMSVQESSKLLRAVARSRGVDVLGSAPQNRLNTYCHKMQNNPGFIKWFVSAVQTGKRPEDAIRNPDIFLEFCLSNVYDYLEAESRRVLRVMQTVPRALSMAEIAYLSNIEPLRLQKAIHSLLTTNMLRMQSIGEGIGTESNFSLSELAREFLDRKHAVSDKDYSTIKRRDQALQKSEEISRQENLGSDYSKYRIQIRNKSDYVIARYLLDALRDSGSGNLDSAHSNIRQAKELAPSYYEVYRVEAWVCAQSRNMPAARRAYEAALELETSSPELHFWYGGFLSRHEKDFEAAIDSYETAAKLKPNWPQPILEISRTMAFRGDYDAANSKLVKFRSQNPNISKRVARIFWDLFLRIPIMEAEHLIRAHDYTKVVELVETLLSRLDEAPRALIDRKITGNFLKALGLVKRCKFQIQDESELEKANDVQDRLETELSYLGIDVHNTSAKPVLIGSVIRKIDPKFGYLRENDSGNEFFFHYGQIRNLRQDREVVVGDILEFDIGENKQGTCAVNILIRN